MSQRRLPPADPAWVGPGLYEHDERIFRVKRSTYSWQSRYVVELEINEHPDGTYRHRWTYRGVEPFEYLTDADTLTYERARIAGRMLGLCVRCDRLLNDVRSVYSGYGKTCAKHQHWPYPTIPEMREIILAMETDDPEALDALATSVFARVRGHVIDNPNTPPAARVLAMLAGGR